jgi:dipeptidyl aminopeptidase/acylaminoacyl peptidase
MLIAPALAALLAAPPAPDLTIDWIMQGPKLVGHAPSALRFSGDSRDLFFEWQGREDDETSTWTVPRAGGPPRRLSEADRRLAPPPSGAWDAAHRRLVFADRGDIALVDTVARVRRQLTLTAEKESNPRWARRGTHVTFTREDGVFMVPAPPAEGDLLVQLVQAGPPEEEPRLTESQRYVKERERELIAWVAEAARKREREEERKKRLAPPRLDLEKGRTVSDAILSAEGRFLYVLVEEKAKDARKVDMPKYVTESAYTETASVRTNVGDAQDRTLLAIYDLQERRVSWAEVGFAGEGRGVDWSLPVLSADGRRAVAVAGSVDRKDRWLVALDPSSGKASVLHHEHQDAWVRDLGRGTYEDANLGFLPDGLTVWFTSEADGWMHLYAVAADGSAAARPLTSGSFELDEVRLASSGRTFLLTSTEGDPAQRHLFTMPAKGGARTRLTAAEGENLGILSPDERTLAILHSGSNRPPEVVVAEARPGATPRQVTTSPSAEWLARRWVEPRLVSYRARDGAQVAARLFTPEMVGRARDPRKPAVVFVHGAGYLQNAHRYWSYYYREYMFHHLLAERGYVVLDPDYRGSAGYGRDWRTGIYRHMGGHDLEDVLDGARWLAGTEGVDPEHIGVYGGSYGGFITLMALFTSPDTFAAGAALRPVTDWAHYNHPYTSNILNTPQADAEAFRRSSPIHFAEGLRAPLLILHGMVDDNVHYQDSVRLAQRLIELRKEGWELAGYPVEAHSFVEETSWADEYKRILALFERHLRGSPAVPRAGRPNPTSATAEPGGAG